MIIDFYKGNGGGGGGTDPQMRASGFTGVELSGTTLEFSNYGGTEVDSVDLSGITVNPENYYTKSEIDAGTSAITETLTGLTEAVQTTYAIATGNTDNINVLSASTTANTENINALGIQVSANTEAIAEISGHTGGDATELQPKTAIPESGAAGTLIAVNKPDEYGWKAYSGYNAEKSRTQISYYVEPSENPNPDLSQYPTRYQIDLAIADSVDEGGNYTYSTSETIELTVDYQGNVSFTNTGSFVQDGNDYVYTASIYDYATGEYITKTLVMSYGDGFLYFNLESGDCPYYINTAYQYYWQDGGYWDYDPETGEPTTWNESWNEMQNTPNYQEWGIANPAKIGIYQANSANTYVEFDAKKADYATEAGFARKIKKYQGTASSDYFNAGDMIISEDYGYRPRVKTGDGDGMDYDYNALAWQGEVQDVENRLNHIQIDEVYPKEETPVYVDNGNLIAVHNSGETVVKQAYAESGFTFIPYNNNAEGCYGVKTYTPNDYMQFSVGIDNGIGEAMVWVFWQNGDWDLSGWNDWTITTTGTSWTATDGRGYEAEGYVDGDYAYVITNAPVSTVYGVNGVSDVRVPQTAYQTAVMSKQGVCQIWKGTAQEYAQISTPDANTIYIII